MKNRIGFLIVFLFVFSCSYSTAALTHQEKEAVKNFTDQVFVLAKNSKPLPAHFLANIHNIKLDPTKKNTLLKRLILTGNLPNIQEFFYHGLLRYDDINDESIRYARERSTENPENKKILAFLLERYNNSRKRKAEDAPDQNRKKVRLKPEKKEPETCGICLEEYSDENPATRMMPDKPNCLHVAHQKCFARWCASAEAHACIFCNNGEHKRAIPENWLQWMFGDPIIED